MMRDRKIGRITFKFYDIMICIQYVYYVVYNDLYILMYYIMVYRNIRIRGASP